MKSESRIFLRPPSHKQFINVRIRNIFAFPIINGFSKLSFKFPQSKIVTISLEFLPLWHPLPPLFEEILLATHNKIVLSHRYIGPSLDVFQSVNKNFPSISELHVWNVFWVCVILLHGNVLLIKKNHKSSSSSSLEIHFASCFGYFFRFFIQQNFW